MAKAFKRIFIIFLENKSEQAVLDNAFMKSLASRGVRLRKYFGVTHPSQPNYIAATAGLSFVVDDNRHDIDATNIVDLLEAKGVSWKAYMEDLPETNKTIHISKNRLYFRKHNPFVSFDNVRNSPSRLAKVVNAKRLQEDAKNNALPQYSWYTPNIQFRRATNMKRVIILADAISPSQKTLRWQLTAAAGSVFFTSNTPARSHPFR